MDGPVRRARPAAALALAAALLWAPGTARAQIDPRIRSLGVFTAYGVVGGALLGIATMAFGSGKRAPFVGASLGLYTGLMFSGYVIGSHAYGRYRERSAEDGYFQDPGSIYQDLGGGGGGYDLDGEARYWDPAGGRAGGRAGGPPPVFIEVLRLRF